MSKSSQIFVYLLITVISTFVGDSYCKVYSRRQNVEPFKTFQLDGRVGVDDVLRRFRRDIKTKTDGPKPETSENKLGNKDEGYNEAIVHWSGDNSEAIFVLTRQRIADGTVPKSKLWRSDNYGTRFTTVTFQDAKAVINYFYTSPVNKNKLVFTDVARKMLYTTVDEGKTFKGNQLLFSPDKLLYHPTDDKYLLAYSFDEHKLYVSNDMGASWDEGISHVNGRFFWAVPTVDAGHDKIIHLEVDDLENGGCKYKAVKTIMDKTTGRDVSDYPTISDIDVDSLLVQDQYIFVQKTTPFDSHLYVSYNRGEFKRAYFPMEAHPQDYSIVSTDQQQVFLAADHKEQVVHLYLSDVTGVYYVQSLSSLVALRSTHGGFDADLHEVEGMNGTYIANQLSGSLPRTYITFDEGGEWNLIPAPEKDHNGKDYNCKLPNCSLNLHLSFGAIQYSIPYILSEDNAPGLIMAQGLVGKQLNRMTSTLFISNDGGQSFKAVLEGEYTHNILDQGGAMVAVTADAMSRSQTKSILYSCDEGSTWTSYDFTDHDIVVDGVLNEPGITTRIISIYGHDPKHGSWIIVKVNFSPILKNNCKEDDYYYWTPSDSMSTDHCLMGQKVTFKLRKSTSFCNNGEEHEIGINSTRCQCEEDDYECDFGYKQKAGSQTECEKETWFDPRDPPWDCTEGSPLNISSGHRRVPASKCKGDGALDKKYAPKTDTCPVRPPSGLHVYSTEHQVAKVGSVTFHITQEKGSKKSTIYTHNCGNSKTSDTKTGYEASSTFQCTYNQAGTYTVTVSASNEKVKQPVTAKTSILVEDAVSGVEVTEPHGAQTNVPVQFRIDVIRDDQMDNALGYVHHVWMFDEELALSEKPMLTYDNEVEHTFTSPGNYSCSVQTFNAVSNIYRQFTVVVYGTLTTVQLTFSSHLMNPLTVEQKDMLAIEIKKQLMEELNVDHRRLEVVMLDVSPQTADVSILPQEQISTSDDSIDELVKALLKKVAPKTLQIPLKESLFGQNQQLNVTSARVLQPGGGSKRKYTAVYVCVPILMLATFLMFLIVLHYKKKFRTLRSTRYSVLHSRSATPGSAQGPDGLLEDDDDDDPLLEPELQSSRLAVTPSDDDDPIGMVIAGRGHGDIGIPQI